MASAIICVHGLERAFVNLDVHRTGAPPPKVATTRHCKPPGCTLFTMSASVWHSPEGPSQSPAFTLHHPMRSVLQQWEAEFWTGSHNCIV